MHSDRIARAGVLRKFYMKFQEITTELCQEIFNTFSVTAALQHWCEARGLSDGMLWSDVHDWSGRTAISPDGARALDLEDGLVPRHRAITLMRGKLPLLDADNWYVPERLPPEAHRLLTETDTPFGTALAGLHQTRVTVAARVPEAVLPLLGGAGRDVADLQADPDVPVLIVRGVVRVGDVPVSYVEERFRPELIEASLNTEPVSVR